ncbi:MAG: hypothetical protein OEV15_01765 [Gallionella sp.]|nr:hypothetical protein [Gallionella sp.]
MSVLFAWGSVALADVPVAASDADSEEVECFPRNQSELPSPPKGGVPVSAEAKPPSVSDCPPLSPARIKLVEDWRRPAQQIQPLSQPKGDAPIPIGTKVKLTLLPSEKVTLVVQEEELKTVKYAGLLTFRTGKAGGYRILSDPYMWFELVPANALDQTATAGKSDKRLKCYGIMRNIVFELAADTRYWFQISGSPDADIELQILPPE